MDKFADLLREAAGLVGVEAVRLWPQVVMITFVQSLFLLVLDLACAVLFAILMRCCRGACPTADDDAGWEECGPMPIAGAVACGALALCCVWMAGLQLPGVLYPEAKTVLDLIARAR